MTAIQTFGDSIADSMRLRELYHHCVTTLGLPGDYGDLLRMSMVYCMSALDKLLHELVVHNMVEIFANRRAATGKYKSETISLEHHLVLASASLPPPEIVFEQIVRSKIAHLSFMDPPKLVDALALIWSEEHKWQAIASEMGSNRESVITELKNLYRRRNSIVHEIDWDPVSGAKMAILPADAERAETFIKTLGEAIDRLVT
jgi:hypothetical protein